MESSSPTAALERRGGGVASTRRRTTVPSSTVAQECRGGSRLLRKSVRNDIRDNGVERRRRHCVRRGDLVVTSAARVRAAMREVLCQFDGLLSRPLPSPRPRTASGGPPPAGAAPDARLEGLRAMILQKLPGAAHHGWRTAYREFRRHAGHVRPVTSVDAPGRRSDPGSGGGAPPLSPIRSTRHGDYHARVRQVQQQEQLLRPSSSSTAARGAPAETHEGISYDEFVRGAKVCAAPPMSRRRARTSPFLVSSADRVSRYLVRSTSPARAAPPPSSARPKPHTPPQTPAHARARHLPTAQTIHPHTNRRSTG